MATSSSLICLSFFLLFTSATCFNITKILDTYPDFSTFNQYLTETKLAAEINKRQTITVLAVANDAMSGIQGSTDVIKHIMGNHVVLDYYDEVKLNKLSKNTALLTTLFQSTSLAEQQQGFLNVTKMKSGEIEFGSAVKGAQLNSRLVKKLAAQPYNISVLQVSAPIVADGIQNAGAPKKAPASTPPAPSPKLAKAKSPKAAEAPEADAPEADAPTAEAPADAPEAETPSDAPTADTPTADAPDAADGPSTADADAADKKASSATRACVGLALVAISSLVAM